MKVTLFIGFLVLLSRAVIAQVVGGSVLAHCYEAIYLYYGYLADVGMNDGQKRTLGRVCISNDGTACTLREFLSSIETEFDAAHLGDCDGLADTTRPGDLQRLARAMRDSGFNRYSGRAIFNKYVHHTEDLNTATQILVQARDNNPDVLQGGLLAKAKRTLLYAQAEREQDSLADRKRYVREAFENAQIVEKQVALDGALITYQDIDWVETARATASANSKTLADVLDSFEDLGRNILNELVGDKTAEQTLKNHLIILQSIRTQSDALGSLAACRAIG